MDQFQILVQEISPATEESALRDFFGFCGEIVSIEVGEVVEGSKTAIIGFNDAQARSTSLLLDRAMIADRPCRVVEYTAPEVTAEAPVGVEAVSVAPEPIQGDGKFGVVSGALGGIIRFGRKTKAKAAQIAQETGVDAALRSAASVTVTTAKKAGEGIKKGAQVVDDNIHVMDGLRVAGETVKKGAQVVDSQLHVTEGATIVAGKVKQGTTAVTSSEAYIKAAEATKNATHQVGTLVSEVSHESQAKAGTEYVEMPPAALNEEASPAVVPTDATLNADPE
ncbi:hypothetical protein KIPB_011323, partial [Kipferlia bialata]|eukprot:g11323.t1